ncbi:MAG: peroxiredoxin [Leptospirillum sp.]
MATDPLKEGDLAPSFSAGVLGYESPTVSLSDLRGRTVVLYFYPKDDTPGCTREACDFRDAFEPLKRAGVVVLGVSRDSLESHGKFVKKYDLNFPLLSDPEGAICTAYGVLKEKSMYGRKSIGIERTTVVIGADGTIRKIYPKVKVDGHVAQIMSFLGLSSS